MNTKMQTHNSKMNTRMKRHNTKRNKDMSNTMSVHVVAVVYTRFVCSSRARYSSADGKRKRAKRNHLFTLAPLRATKYKKDVKITTAANKP